MTYEPIEKTALVEDWKPMVDQARYYNRVYFIFHVIEKTGEKHMGMVFETIYMPLPIMAESEDEWKSAANKEVENAVFNLWKRLATQLEDYHYYDNSANKDIEVNDVQPIDSIPESYKDMIHFYYATA